MSSDKSTFDLEPNPFERSFAPEEALSTRSNSLNNLNRHNLKIPNILSLNSAQNTQNKLPAITPTGFTPNDRKLPPIGFLPGAASNPDTPGGSNLWNSLLNVTSNGSNPKAGGTNIGGSTEQPNYNPQFNLLVSTLRKTGLTPNELNLRSGFTPGGTNGFPFLLLPGLTTPGAMLNSPMTPGLLSLLGITTNNTNLGPVMQPPTIEEKKIHETDQNGQNRQNGDHNGQNDPISQPPQLSINSTKNSQEQTPTKSVAPIKEETKKRRGAGNLAAKKRKTEKKEVKKIEHIQEEVEEEGDENLGADEKRKVFLERNRIAASKCRQRKKQLVQKMEDELAFYASGYREASARVDQLRTQLGSLMDILGAHKDCPALINLMGGYEQFENIMQQTKYLTLISENTVGNLLSIPTTIPTTLTNLKPQQQFRENIDHNGVQGLGPAALNAPVPSQNVLPGPGMANHRLPLIQGQHQGQHQGHHQLQQMVAVPGQPALGNQAVPMGHSVGPEAGQAVGPIGQNQTQVLHQHTMGPQVQQGQQVSQVQQIPSHQMQPVGQSVAHSETSSQQGQNIGERNGGVTSGRSSQLAENGGANGGHQQRLDLRPVHSMTNMAEPRDGSIDNDFSLRLVSSMADLQQQPGRPNQENYGIGNGSLMDPNNGVLHLHS